MLIPREARRERLQGQGWQEGSRGRGGAEGAEWAV